MRFALRDVEAGRVQPVISEATVRRQYQRIFSVAVAALGAILAANLIAESDSLYRPAWHLACNYYRYSGNPWWEGTTPSMAADSHLSCPCSRGSGHPARLSSRCALASWVA